MGREALAEITQGLEAAPRSLADFERALNASFVGRAAGVLARLGVTGRPSRRELRRKFGGAAAFERLVEADAAFREATEVLEPAGRTLEAARLYLRAADEDPQHLSALERLGRCGLRLGGARGAVVARRAFQRLLLALRGSGIPPGDSLFEEARRGLVEAEGMQASSTAGAPVATAASRPSASEL